MLDRVTITGPDDGTDFNRLIEISEAHPFVEWGILASASQEGNPRFPSRKWFKTIKPEAKLNLSLHLCGRWVRDLLLGDITFPTEILEPFQRVQLNFHAENTPCAPDRFAKALQNLGPRQFIFQIDGAHGNTHLYAAQRANPELSLVPLFDISGGAGILPEFWPQPQPEFSYHGYAGGLGPDNLLTQIPLILQAAGNSRIWIDMETKVRSADDKVFVLDKVTNCLEQSSRFIARI